MSNSVDVVKELQEKNKEIYYNKLNMDIDNNQEVLMITLQNVLDMLFQEFITKIQEIIGITIDESNQINNLVVAFQKNLINELNNGLTLRSKNLKEKVENEDIAYMELLDLEKKTLLTTIREFYQNNIETIKCIGQKYNEFEQKRLEEYLNILFLDKLLLKIRQVIDNSNIILCNNYEDSLEKYHNLNARTLKL